MPCSSYIQIITRHFSVMNVNADFTSIYEYLLEV